MALNVNALVAYPPAWHPEADSRGKGWPQMMARAQAQRAGMRTPVHAWIDVNDRGDNLVRRLGLSTVPTHALVGASGQLLCTLGRKQLPRRAMVEALLRGGSPGSEFGGCTTS